MHAISLAHYDCGFEQKKNNKKKHREQPKTSLQVHIGKMLMTEFVPQQQLKKKIFFIYKSRIAIFF